MQDRQKLRTFLKWADIAVSGVIKQTFNICKWLLVRSFLKDNDEVFLNVANG